MSRRPPVVVRTKSLTPPAVAKRALDNRALLGHVGHAAVARLVVAVEVVTIATAVLAMVGRVSWLVAAEVAAEEQALRMMAVVVLVIEAVAAVAVLFGRVHQAHGPSIVEPSGAVQGSHHQVGPEAAAD